MTNSYHVFSVGIFFFTSQLSYLYLSSVTLSTLIRGTEMSLITIPGVRVIETDAPSQAHCVQRGQARGGKLQLACKWCKQRVGL